MIRRFLDVSSGHLSADTWTWLDAQFADDELRDPSNIVAGQLAGGRTRYGWFVYAPEDLVVDIPTDLLRVFSEARKHRCAYVLLDCDAPPHPNLPLVHPNFADGA